MMFCVFSTDELETFSTNIQKNIFHHNNEPCSPNYDFNIDNFYNYEEKKEKTPSILYDFYSQISYSSSYQTLCLDKPIINNNNNICSKYHQHQQQIQQHQQDEKIHHYYQQEEKEEKYRHDQHQQISSTISQSCLEKTRQSKRKNIVYIKRGCLTLQFCEGKRICKKTKRGQYLSSHNITQFKNMCSKFRLPKD